MATNAMSREGTKKNNSLRDFQGVNTQSARQVIGDNQFAWLENVHPVGFGNMPAIPAQSASLATWTGMAYKMKSVNIAGIDYMLVFNTAGACFSVNLNNYAVGTVGPAGTFGGSDTDVAQWENTLALITDPIKGYFTWNGSTLSKINGTLQSLTITSIGTGYTSSPTVAFTGGGGTGAAATCHISVGLVSVTAGGTGYNVGDIAAIAGGTFSDAAAVRVSAITVGGVISGINLVATGDYTVAPSSPAASTSLYGTGATFTLNFGIGPITLTSPGTGYTSTPTVTISGGGGSGGTVEANLSAVPTGGYAIATYAGRAWIAFNRTVVFSAPDAPTDFSEESGGGSFVMSDETLHSRIIALRSANNFLYIVGTSSVNVIADVSIVNGETVFSNTNISASIGTSQEYSVFPYYRALWFAAPYGIYALYGSTTQKASDDLDGIFPFINAPNEYSITAGAAVIHNILTLCFMFRYNDQVRGVTRTLIACFAGKKWFFASQGDNLIYLDSVVHNGTPTAYATDGSRLYSLFTNAISPVEQKIVTKLWDMGDPLSGKQAIKFGLEVINPVAFQNITGTIDTEITSGSVEFTLDGANQITWINNAGYTVDWTNDDGDVVTWSTSGYSFLPMDVQTAGRYIGVTLNGSSAGTVYSGMHLQFEHREQWPQGGPM